MILLHTAVLSLLFQSWESTLHKMMGQLQQALRLSSNLPSGGLKYNEGLPVTILETMSFGIPNISTMVAAIPEVIVNNQNGMLVKPGDVRSLACAIDYMITNPEERVKMSKKAYNTVMDKFLMGHYLELLFDIYKELLAR